MIRMQTMALLVIIVLCDMILQMGGLYLGMLPVCLMKRRVRWLLFVVAFLTKTCRILNGC